MVRCAVRAASARPRRSRRERRRRSPLQANTLVGADLLQPGLAFALQAIDVAGGEGLVVEIAGGHGADGEGVLVVGGAPEDLGDLAVGLLPVGALSRGARRLERRLEAVGRRGPGWWRAHRVDAARAGAVDQLSCLGEGQ